MLTRLGPEAAEAIDEFLDAALAYDRDAAPSLQGFIDQLREGDVEIKRDMEQERNEVRIMTVHGAKGLQAPIVFLPDTCMPPRLQGVRLYALPRAGERPDEVGHLIWPPAGLSKLAGIERQQGFGGRAEREEYHRLLYVAMTRAEDRLYICGWEGLQKRESGIAWYDLVKDGLGGLLTARRLRRPNVQRMETHRRSPRRAEAEPERARRPLPVWAFPRRRRSGRGRSCALAPCAGLEDAPKRSPDQPPLGPRARATMAASPAGDWCMPCCSICRRSNPNIKNGRRALSWRRAAFASRGVEEEIVAETLAIVRDPTFAPLFRPGSLAEVPVVAQIGGDERKAISTGLPSSTTSCSSSTTRPTGRRPRRSRRWRRLYRPACGLPARAEGLFPGHSLRAALLWTDGPRLMEIPSTSLDGAERRMLQRAHSLDGMGAHT